MYNSIDRFEPFEMNNTNLDRTVKFYSKSLRRVLKCLRRTRNIILWLLLFFYTQYWECIDREHAKHKFNCAQSNQFDSIRST